MEKCKTWDDVFSTIKELIQENKVLKEDNQKLREYIEQLQMGKRIESGDTE